MRSACAGSADAGFAKQMKLLIIADIDDLHWKHGEGRADILLSCGDVADPVILGAARAYQCARIFAVKGNHDSDRPFPKPIVDLHLRVHAFDSMTFGGLNGSWRYKPRGHFLYEQEEVSGLLRAFPPVDVLVSHNSPQGIHDKDDGIHFGFEGLTAYIRRAKPTAVIHGHQHINKETALGETRIIGVRGHRQMEF